MMNNHEVNQLVEAIQIHLDGGSGPIPAEIAAHQYAKECGQVNERLARIAMMLDSGGDMEALQVAEVEPRLMDRAILLSFGQESEWGEFCKLHDHQQAAPIVARTLDVLDALYKKGISSNHPLYTKYRGAVLSRNEDEAYETIKIIARLNPADANATRELDRHERKMVMRLLVSLKKSVAESNDEDTLDSLSAIEKTQREDDYKETPVYKDAIALRMHLRKAATLAEIPDMLNDAEDELGAAGDWRKAARISAEIEARMKRHGIALNQQDLAQLEKINNTLGELRQEAERMAKVTGVTADLRRLAEAVEINLVTPSGLDHEFASSSLKKLLRCQREMVTLRGNLQSGDQARVDGVIGQLEQVLKRRRSGRKLRLVSICTFVGILLLTASTFGWFSSQASKRIALLVKLQDDGQSVALGDQLKMIQASDAILLKFPKLSSQWSISDQWVRGQQGSSIKVNKLLDKLETQSDESFSGKSPAEVYNAMEEAKEILASLPSDLRDEAASKLMIIRNEADRYLSAAQNKAADEARGVLLETGELLESIEPEGPAQAAKVILDRCMTRLASLVEMSGQAVPILRLPVSVESQLTERLDRVKHVLVRTEGTLGALDEVNRAATITGYLQGMNQLAAASGLESELARRIVEGFPDDSALRAFLLFDGKLSALAAAKRQMQAGFPIPEAARIDRDVIRDLSSNPAIANLWELHWTKKGESLHGYSSGELESRVLARVEKFEHKEWYGKVAESPKSRGGDLIFAEYKKEDQNPVISTYADGVFKSNKMTAVSQMILGMNLDKLLDNTGSEYKRSIIPLIDQVFRNTDVPTLAKAYVVNRLFSLLADREIEWGMHFVPELLSDMKAARAIEMEGQISASYWLTPKDSEIDRSWKRYFDDRLDRRYYRDFQLFRALVKSLLTEPISLAAIVSSEGGASIKVAEEPRIIWGFTANAEGEREMKLLGVVAARSTKLTIPSNLLPLSPLLGVRLEDSAQQKYLLNLHGLK
jgi:hypothetical protein